VEEPFRDCFLRIYECQDNTQVDCRQLMSGRLINCLAAAAGGRAQSHNCGMLQQV